MVCFKCVCVCVLNFQSIEFGIGINMSCDCVSICANSLLACVPSLLRSACHSLLVQFSLNSMFKSDVLKVVVVVVRVTRSAIRCHEWVFVKLFIDCCSQFALLLTDCSDLGRVWSAHDMCGHVREGVSVA